MLCAARGYEPLTMKRVDPTRSALAIRLQLRPPGQTPAARTVTGRVLDPQHRPVAGAAVTINSISTGTRTSFGALPPGADVAAVSDATGEFEIYCAKPFTALGLAVDAPGLARQKFTKVPPGKRQDLVLSLGAALTGRVVRDGKPVKGINIGVAGVDRNVETFTRDFVVGTDDNGVFVFPNLPPDRDYEFYGVLDSLRGVGALPARVVRVGSDGSKIDLGTIELTPGWRVAGEVRLTTGKPLPVGTRLILGREKAWDFSVVDLPADGRFDLPNVPGEPVSLRVGIEGFQPAANQPQLGKLTGDRTGLVLVMEPRR